MRRDEWARLAAPFPAHALDWHVVRIDREESIALVEPVVGREALVARLDDTLGVDGWSVRFLPAGTDALVCELGLLGVTKSALARSFHDLLGMGRVEAFALGRAARLLGLRPPAARSAWVDIDLESGEVLAVPEAESQDLDGFGTGDGRVQGVDSRDGAGATAAAAQEPAPPAAVPSEPESGLARSQGQQAIERLVDRLRAEGRGTRAAALIVEHGGYGRSPEEARELYRKLRELLLEKGATT